MDWRIVGMLACLGLALLGTSGGGDEGSSQYMFFALLIVASMAALLVLAASVWTWLGAWKDLLRKSL